MREHQLGALRPREGRASVDDEGRDAVHAAALHGGFGFRYLVGAFGSGQAGMSGLSSNGFQWTETATSPGSLATVRSNSRLAT